MRLLEQIGQLQHALWQHVIVTPTARGMSSGEPAVRFVPDTGGAPDQAIASEPAASPIVHQKRVYQHKQIALPRWWHTRSDPFAEVWAEIEQWLEADPTRTATSIVQTLHQRDPEQYPTTHLCTLQRRIAKWRATMITTFDNQWLQDELLADTQLPRPLGVVRRPDATGELPTEA